VNNQGSNKEIKGTLRRHFLKSQKFRTYNQPIVRLGQKLDKKMETAATYFWFPSSKIGLHKKKEFEVRRFNFLITKLSLARNPKIHFVPALLFGFVKSITIKAAHQTAIQAQSTSATYRLCYLRYPHYAHPQTFFASRPAGNIFRLGCTLEIWYGRNH